jgi:hypothetical protein
MASITIAGVFLNEADDLDDYLSFDSYISVDASETEEGELRDYAGGRRRYIGTDNNFASVSLQLPLVSKASREKLETWPGVTLLYRDGRGRMFYGVFSTMRASELRGPGDYSSVSLTLSEISRDIEV